MANATNDKDPRCFLYLKEVKPTLAEYSKSDPRFDNMSDCARHLIVKGIEADKKDREKAINSLSE